jgi:hypothetical protein
MKRAIVEDDDDHGGEAAMTCGRSPHHDDFICDHEDNPGSDDDDDDDYFDCGDHNGDRDDGDDLKIRKIQTPWQSHDDNNENSGTAHRRMYKKRRTFLAKRGPTAPRTVPVTRMPTTTTPIIIMPTTTMPTTIMTTTTTTMLTTTILITTMPIATMPITTMPIITTPTTIIPTTTIPTTKIPMAEILTTGIPTTRIPTTRIPTTIIPTTRIPRIIIPRTTIPRTIIPRTIIPRTIIPTTIIPTTIVPTTTIPTTTIPTITTPTITTSTITTPTIITTPRTPIIPIIPITPTTPTTITTTKESTYSPRSGLTSLCEAIPRKARPGRSADSTECVAKHSGPKGKGLNTQKKMKIRRGRPTKYPRRGDCRHSDRPEHRNGVCYQCSSNISNRGTREQAKLPIENLTVIQNIFPTKTPTTTPTTASMMTRANPGDHPSKAWITCGQSPHRGGFATMIQSKPGEMDNHNMPDVFSTPLIPTLDPKHFPTVTKTDENLSLDGLEYRNEQISCLLANPWVQHEIVKILTKAASNGSTKSSLPIHESLILDSKEVQSTKSRTISSIL